MENRNFSSLHHIPLAKVLSVMILFDYLGSSLILFLVPQIAVILTEQIKSVLGSLLLFLIMCCISTLHQLERLL